MTSGAALRIKINRGTDHVTCRAHKSDAHIDSHLPSHIRPLSPLLSQPTMSTATTSRAPASSTPAPTIVPITKDEVLALAGRLKAAMEVQEGEKAQVEERLRKELVSLAFDGMSAC